MAMASVCFSCLGSGKSIKFVCHKQSQTLYLYAFILNILYLSAILWKMTKCETNVHTTGQIIGLKNVSIYNLNVYIMFTIQIDMVNSIYG